MKENTEIEVKKAWDPPVLTIFGSVESLTQSGFPCTNKTLGGSDGLTFNNIPIQCTS